MRSRRTLHLWALLAFCSCDKREPALQPLPVPAPEAIQERPADAPPNAAPSDAEVTASGLAMQVLTPGTGEQRPKLQDKVRLSFQAWNASGKLTDGSAQRGGPVTFEVDGVIKGWSEALQLMRVGEKRRLWVPDHLTYPGRPGYPRPPALFEIELLEIVAGPAPEPAPTDLAAAPKDAVKLASGLAWKRLQHDKAHAAERPRAWDQVALVYSGWAEDGRMFGSSRRQPERFEMSNVIPSWREALHQMSVGDKVRLWVPDALASHGRKGEPPGRLVYDLELVSIEQRPPPPRAPAQLASPPAGTTRTASGLAYRFLARGSAERHPGPHDRVTVHYSAWTSDGKLLDSSVVAGKPRTVPLDRLIAGWSEGLQLMAEGDKTQLWIPERLAYAGRDGSPRGDLVYEVELLQVLVSGAP
jgi:FKBP-type peptidyl-prolyl cis-trans isomerase